MGTQTIETQTPTTTVQVPRDMHEQVKEAAKQDVTTTGKWYERVVREALAKRKNGKRTS